MTIRPTIDLDMWHQMALIREAFELGKIPYSDCFAFTPTVYPVVHHEWGCGLVAYPLMLLMGGTGIVVLKYGLVFTLGWILYQYLRKQKVSLITSLFTLPISMLMLSAGFSTVRGQIYSFLFAALCLWFFLQDREGSRRWIKWFIPLFLLWVNLHGGFILAFFFLGAYGFEQWMRKQPCRHLLVLMVMCAGLIVVNPYGYHMYPYMWHALTMPRPLIQEWGPIWIHLDWPVVLILGTSLLLLLYAYWKTPWRELEHGWMLLFLLIGTIFVFRLLFFYAIVWTYTIPAALSRTPLNQVFRNIWKEFPIVLMALFSIASVFYVGKIVFSKPWHLEVTAQPPSKLYYPVGAVEYLKVNAVEGDLFVSFNWGSYVMWKLHPKIKISLDSRYEAAYPPSMMDEMHDFYKANPSWKEILKKYNPTLILVNKSDKIQKELDALFGWEKVYQDNQSALYAWEFLHLPSCIKIGPLDEGVIP
ncbi:MAG: hypothetical protein RBU29_08615 [bacterium]|jgi:hypothetical protein|nr:hypothetical protein [bacterium]